MPARSDDRARYGARNGLERDCLLLSPRRSRLADSCRDPFPFRTLQNKVGREVRLGSLSSLLPLRPPQWPPLAGWGQTIPDLLTPHPQALNFPLDWYGSDQSTVEKWAETGSKIMLGAAAKWPAYGTSNLNLVLSSAALTPGGRALSYLWW